MYDEALGCGLTAEEAREFVYMYPWIESLLHRAYQSSGAIFGLYRFSDGLYDRLSPASLSPEPKQRNRNMWVMLSNIKNNADDQVISFPEPFDEKESTTEDFTYNEYGLTNIYCSHNKNTAEDEFFGFDFSGYINGWMITEIDFYENSLAESIAEDVSGLGFGIGLQTFDIADYDETGIIYDTSIYQQPVALGKNMCDNGKLIALGTAEFFLNTENYRIFLNNCLEEIMDTTSGFENPAKSAIQNNISLWPNPFSSGTTISFTLEEASLTQIDLFSLNGKKLKTIFNKRLNAGIHNIRVQTGNLQNGVYICRIKTNNKAFATRMVKINF